MSTPFNPSPEVLAAIERLRGEAVTPKAVLVAAGYEGEFLTHRWFVRMGQYLRHIGAQRISSGGENKFRIPEE